MKSTNHCFHNGFTLAELLIALAILGVIATFTIPKVLQAQQNAKFNAIAKETAGTLTQAYQKYTAQNGISVGAGIKDLTPYLNYVSIDTVGQIDDVQGYGAYPCAPCVRLHNGSAFVYDSTDNFTGTSALNAVNIILDPDGNVTDSTTNGPGKSVKLFLYANGAIRDWGNIPNGTISTSGSAPSPANNPSWFSWN